MKDNFISRKLTRREQTVFSILMADMNNPIVLPKVVTAATIGEPITIKIPPQPNATEPLFHITMTGTEFIDAYERGLQSVKNKKIMLGVGRKMFSIIKSKQYPRFWK